MERKKLHNDTSLEELLQAASEQDQNSIIDDGVFESDIPSFIIRHQLKAGDRVAHPDLIYRIYKTHSSSPVSKVYFTREFSLYFPRKSGYYLINKDPSELIADLSTAIKRRRSPRIRQKATKLQFQSFLNKLEVDKGEEWIEFHVIAHFYDKWIYETKRKRAIKLADLVTLMRVFFQNKRTKDGYVFKIKHNFPKESVENLRIAWKRKKQKDQ
jgi:hypothetical protein